MQTRDSPAGSGPPPICPPPLLSTKDEQGAARQRCIRALLFCLLPFHFGTFLLPLVAVSAKGARGCPLLTSLRVAVVIAASNLCLPCLILVASPGLPACSSFFPLASPLFPPPSLHRPRKIQDCQPITSSPSSHLFCLKQIEIQDISSLMRGGGVCAEIVKKKKEKRGALFLTSIPSQSMFVCACIPCIEMLYRPNKWYLEGWT